MKISAGQRVVHSKHVVQHISVSEHLIYMFCFLGFVVFLLFNTNLFFKIFVVPPKRRKIETC